MAAKFKVYGPKSILLEKRPGGRFLSPEVKAKFWEKNLKHKDDKGVSSHLGLPLALVHFTLVKPERLLA